MIPLWVPMLLVLAYLTLLGVVSEAVERSPRLALWARHPATFVLALGVYATSFTLFGGVGFAAEHGFSVLGFYLGVTLACLAIPVLWLPLARRVRRARWTSVADLLASRFASRRMGAVVTVLLLFGLLPYLSLQMRAIGDAAEVLAGATPHELLAPTYAALLSIFAGVVGVRYADPRAQRPGLLATMALESVVKVVGAATVGLGALYGVFGGVEGLSAHLAAHPERAQQLADSMEQGPWAALSLVAFAGAFLLPRQFHIAFVERPNDRALWHAIWGLPLLLWVVNLPLPVLLLAGELTAPAGTPPDVYVLTWTQDPLFQLVAFLAGVSASSAMVLLSTLALSGMVINHLVLPLWSGTVTYEQLGAARRVAIVAMVAAGFSAHMALPRGGPLVDLGLVSFSVVLQLLPGVLAALFWPRATRDGVLAGLLVGTAVVVVATALPLLRLGTPLALDPRDGAVFLSVGLNIVFLVVGSLARVPRASVQEVAAAMREGGGLGMALAPTVAAFEARLARRLGPEVAAGEVQEALARLGLDADERRPGALLELAEEVEANLSVLVGPVAAREVVRADAAPIGPVAAQLRVLTGQSAGSMPFMAAWQYLLSVLRQLPVGVAAVDDGGRVVLWNRAAREITGLATDQVVGAPLTALASPWERVLPSSGEHVLGGAAAGRGGRVIRVIAEDLHAAGGVVLFEDLTHQRALQTQLAHRDRLATVGRLAAGVAHEIRNPLTGMLMLVRNLQRELEDAEVVDRLDRVVGEGDRIAGIVTDLLDYSHTSGLRLQIQELHLNEVVQEAVRFARLEKQASARTWTEQLGEVPVVRADRSRLLQVLVNLLTNACDAAGEGGGIEVRTRTEAPDRVVVEVVDDGEGVPADVEASMFEPFVTSKPTGRGTGLGLAVSYRLVAAHGGHLGYARQGDRTVFAVVLPRSPELS